MSKRYYPNIKFSVSLAREKKIFLERKRNLQKFLPAEISFVTNRKYASYRNELLSSYLDVYYSDKKKFLIESVRNTKSKWQKVEKKFFIKVDKIFNNWPWPKGNYRGYVSIAHSFPRNIKDKTFSFPVKDYIPGRENNDIRVIAHEMLHFIEYDYLQKKFGLKASEHDSFDNTFWQFTENLNVLIQNTSFWKEFSTGVKSKPYDDCKKMYNKMKSIWDRDKSIDRLVDKIFYS